MKLTDKNELLCQYANQTQTFFSEEILTLRENYEVYVEETDGYGGFRVRPQDCFENGSCCGWIVCGACVLGCLNGEFCNGLGSCLNC